jgi:hypothetical protein
MNDELTRAGGRRERNRFNRNLCRCESRFIGLVSQQETVFQGPFLDRATYGVRKKYQANAFM